MPLVQKPIRPSLTCLSSLSAFAHRQSLCGGGVLGLTMNHSVVEAMSSAHFMEMWASIARGGAGAAGRDAPLPPCFDHWLATRPTRTALPGGAVVEWLVELVGRIAAISDFRNAYRRQFCNLSRRIRLLAPMLEEAKDSRRPGRCRWRRRPRSGGSGRLLPRRGAAPASQQWQQDIPGHCYTAVKGLPFWRESMGALAPQN
ncbi:hypothetical protein ACP70R_017389 [Stipagrostis hirtigluma subsp. patula]